MLLPSLPLTLFRLFPSSHRAPLFLAACAATFFLLAPRPVHAQVDEGERVVNGIVTDAQTDQPLPGVNVLAKGTQAGTSTGPDGRYSLAVPAEADSLIFSFVGYERVAEAVRGRSEIDVAMPPAVALLEDVVVTAFGVEREERELGYAVQDVPAEQITETQESNLVNALRGQVAGAQITSTGGAPGQGARIIIRGVTSLNPSADNQPLFVVDGIPISNGTVPGDDDGEYAFSNGIADLNPEDIKSVSVLKGPAASALYGIRAANGAVVIETKTGAVGGTRVNFSTTVGFEEVSKFPELQTEYLAGWYGEPNYGNYSFPFHAWGPHRSEVEDAQFYDNNRNFFSYDGMGTKIKNNLSISGGGENATFYISGSFLDHEGVVPESHARNTSVRARGSVNLTEDFQVSASANYIKSGDRKVHVRGILDQLVYWPTSIDVTDFEGPQGTQDVYTPWLDNPLYIAQNRPLTTDRNRIIGQVALDYDLTDWISLHYKLGNDYYTETREEVVPGPLGVPGENPLDAEGLIDQDDFENRELTSTFRATFSRDLSEDLNATLRLGNDIFASEFDEVSVTGYDFGTPADFYALQNTARLESSRDGYERRVVGVYGDLNLNYQDLVYLNVTGRNDWSSTLPEQNRSFFYPSVSVGFVFSDLFDTPDFWDFGKLRASYAQVGKDAPAYATGITYVPLNFLDQTALTKSGQLGDPNLKPERTTSVELGTDLRFFGDRLGMDLTVYQQNSQDQIIPVPISNATGYTTFLTNAGEIRNRGIEIALRGTPVQMNNFTWQFRTNFAKNENEVVSIREGIETITLAGASYSYGGSLIQQLIPGHPYGLILGPVYQRYYENPENKDPLFIDEDRPILIGEDGFPVRHDGYKVVGNMNPDWTAGINNTLRYDTDAFGSFDLSFLIDIKQGGDLYNQAAAFYAAQGTLPETTNRDEFRVFEGVTADGSENTKEVWLGQGVGPDGVNYGDGFYRNIYRRVSEHFVEDASWVRLRTLSLSYRLPDALIGSLPLSQARLTFTGNNLWVSTPYSGFDPESRQFSAGSNTQGFQGLGTPPVRTYNVSLNLRF